MARWWRQERSPWATASWPRQPDAPAISACPGKVGTGFPIRTCASKESSNSGTAPAGRPGSPPAQQEHRLLAEQVPEPPRRVQTQRPPPGIERHRLLHLGPGHVAELAEILDGAEMDIG